ncbi:peptidylprolyl isomerase [Paenibacillus mesophilus]|uniref:peptidylprolyl isomerase n=1 Tax=Paenibacillus mesophilus TaxID=2582849 RepID=UPI0013052D56|nr:peptidylprolyl isomerase [Paenibacillus mesophilus]
MSGMELTALSVNGWEWRLGDLLRVACIDGGFTAVESVIRRAVILQYAEERQISVDEPEEKAKVNEIRQQMGLYSAAETMAWLEQRGLETEDLYESARARILEEKVKRIVTEDRIEAYFLQNRRSFDRANLSQLVISTREQAQELLFQIEEGESFFKLAQTYCLNASSRFNGGYVGWVGRTALSAEEEAFVFGAEARETGGPFPAGSGWRLLHVWEVAPTELTEELRSNLADLLFDEWLDEAVKRSDVDVNLWRYLAGDTPD